MYNIQLMLTKKCNQSCYYCTTHNDDSVEVDLDYLRFVLDQLPDYTGVELTGGEVGLIDNIDEIYQIVKDHKSIKHIAVLSNGLMRVRGFDWLKDVEYWEHLIQDIHGKNIHKFYDLDLEQDHKYVIVTTEVTTKSLLENWNYFDKLGLFRPNFDYKIMNHKSKFDIKEYVTDLISLYKRLGNRYFKQMLSHYHMPKIMEKEKLLCQKWSPNPFVDFQTHQLGHCAMNVELSNKVHFSHRNLGFMIKGAYSKNDYCKKCYSFDNGKGRSELDNRSYDQNIYHTDMKGVEKQAMIKRAKPFYRREWVERLEGFLEQWDYYKEGAVMELEKKVAEHVGRKHGIGANSTTNSIFMNLFVWSRKYPDRKEVIMSNWGYPAAYKACDVLGLEPVHVDINEYTLGMTGQGVFDVLNANTLAVVHIENNGVIGDPEDIKDVLTDDILFLEDSAPSLLQEKAGTFGDIAMFSFSPTKPFCAGEGSIMVTDNDDLAYALRKFRYIGEYTDLTTSLNCAMSCILATYILPQFDIIDEICQMREWVHEEYKKYIQIFQEPYISTNRHGAIMYQSESAAEISKKLTQLGVEHRHAYYPCFIENDIDFPVSNKVKREMLDLPMHKDLKPEQIKFICDVIRKVEDE